MPPFARKKFLTNISLSEGLLSIFLGQKNLNADTKNLFSNVLMYSFSLQKKLYNLKFSGAYCVHCGNVIPLPRTEKKPVEGKFPPFIYIYTYVTL